MGKGLRALSALAVVVGALVTVAIACGSDSSDDLPSSTDIDAEATERLTALKPSAEVVTYNERYHTGTLPRDAIAPIYEPEFASPDDLDLWPNELVMGVEINGEARAYPIGLMRAREMVNDVVGGVPILVSW